MVNLVFRIRKRPQWEYDFANLFYLVVIVTKELRHEILEKEMGDEAQGEPAKEGEKAVLRHETSKESPDRPHDDEG